MIISIFLALVLCFLNSLIALIIYKIAIKKDKNKFFKMVFVSLTIRYLIIIILMWFFLKVFELDRLAFSLTFLLATFVFIILEILYINFRLKLISLQNNLKK